MPWANVKKCPVVLNLRLFLMIVSVVFEHKRSVIRLKLEQLCGFAQGELSSSDITRAGFLGELL